MEPRIQRAIDIFLDAVNNGTLAKGTCRACAVGNLVAAGQKGNITKNNFMSYTCTTSNADWARLFCTNDSKQSYFSDPPNSAQENIEATEFTVEELMAIEYAFETNTDLCHSDYYFHTLEEIRQDQINGLKAVVEVMLSFSPTEEDNDIVECFVKDLESIPI